MKVTQQKRSWLEVFTFQPPKETVQFYNPLNVKVGVVVNLNLPDYTGKDWTLQRINEYTRLIMGDEFITTYYDLECRASASGQYDVIRLAANPIKGAKKDDAYKYELLLLKKDAECGYSDVEEQLHDADENKVWAVDDDGLDDSGNKVGEPYHDEYQRSGGLSTPYQVNVAIVEDEDDNGQLDATEIKHAKVEYRDFERQVEDAPGALSTEFYIVETNKNDGWTTMWKGDVIDPSVVTVL